MQITSFPLNRRKSIEARLPRVTVGLSDGMFRGDDHFAIQGAVDYVARFGGGIVHVLPGHYRLRNTILLPDCVTLVGSGAASVLEKEPSLTTKVAHDCDGCRWLVEVEETDAFQVGDGITLTSRNIDGGAGSQHSIHTVCGIEGNRLYLDRLPGGAYWVDCGAKVVSTHSLIEARGARDVAIKDILLAGNQAQNEELDGNYGAAIYLREAENVQIQNVTINDFNGDGISWQICHDVQVSDCTIQNVAALGLHPGTGSLRPVMRNNTLRNCKHGIHWCWDVNHGIAESNQIYDCSEHGIAIGHRDTDNVIARNTIENCLKTGIYFRPERSAERTAHRTRVEENVVKCPASSPDSRGIEIVRGVEDTVLRGNTILLRGQSTENAIVVDATAARTILEENHVASE